MSTARANKVQCRIDGDAGGEDELAINRSEIYYSINYRSYVRNNYIYTLILRLIESLSKTLT